MAPHVGHATARSLVCDLRWSASLYWLINLFEQPSTELTPFPWYQNGYGKDKEKEKLIEGEQEITQQQETKKTTNEKQAENKSKTRKTVIQEIRSEAGRPLTRSKQEVTDLSIDTR